jgi:hypothetical protein
MAGGRNSALGGAALLSNSSGFEKFRVWDPMPLETMTRVSRTRRLVRSHCRTMFRGNDNTALGRSRALDQHCRPPKRGGRFISPLPIRVRQPEYCDRVRLGARSHQRKLQHPHRKSWRRGRVPNDSPWRLPHLHLHRRDQRPNLPSAESRSSSLGMGSWEPSSPRVASRRTSATCDQASDVVGLLRPVTFRYKRDLDPRVSRSTASSPKKSRRQTRVWSSMTTLANPAPSATKR